MWPFKARKSKPLPIPDYIGEARYGPIEVKRVEPPKEEGIVVDEVDTSQMTRTGIHKAWDRLSGKFKGE